METLLPRTTSHSDPNRSRATSTLTQSDTSVNSRVWRWLAVLQGYNVDIRHIPGKKNPADSLSRQLVTDALVRKSSVTDANAEYVQRLRVPEDATNEQIQTALHKLFHQGPQGTQFLTTNEEQALKAQRMKSNQLLLQPQYLRFKSMIL